MRPGVERDGDVLPGVLRRLLDGGAAAQDDEVGEGDLRVVGLRAVEVLPDLLEGRQHAGEPVVDLPVALRREADPRPVGPAALVGAAEARRRRPGQGDQLGDRQARAEDALLERGDVLVGDQLVVDRRDGVLPQLRLGHPRAEVAGQRTHVAVQQLVPGLRERVRELGRVLVETLRDRLVDRVQPQREVRGQHHRGVPPRRVVRVGHGALRLGVLGRPLLRPGRAGGQLPVVAGTGCPGSRCPTSPARWSRRPRARW